MKGVSELRIYGPGRRLRVLLAAGAYQTEGRNTPIACNRGLRMVAGRWATYGGHADGSGYSIQNNPRFFRGNP